MVGDYDEMFNYCILTFHCTPFFFFNFFLTSDVLFGSKHSILTKKPIYVND